MRPRPHRLQKVHLSRTPRQLLVWESDESDVDGHSDVGDMEHPILGEVAGGFEEVLASAVTRVAFTTLDGVDLG